MSIVYLSLGSNVEPRLFHLKQALSELALVRDTAVEAVSGVYLTQPVDCVDPDPFYNICARIQTTLSPEALLEYTRNIEAKLMRTRSYRNAPRTIDIDLLLFEGETRDTKTLILPHPRMEQRAFVLRPLLDVADSALKKNIAKQLKKIKGQEVTLTSEQL